MNFLYSLLRSEFTCFQSVGFSGGYIQGGGHSVLSSMLGLAADSVLSYEVITTTGNFVTASPTENKDLYWAMSGGVSFLISAQDSPSLP